MPSFQKLLWILIAGGNSLSGEPSDGSPSLNFYESWLSGLIKLSSEHCDKLSKKRPYN